MLGWYGFRLVSKKHVYGEMCQSAIFKAKVKGQGQLNFKFQGQTDNNLIKEINTQSDHNFKKWHCVW